VTSIKELALMAADAADTKKAGDIVIMDVADLLVVTDYFVVCTGTSAIQVRAIADGIEEEIRVREGVKPIGREGADEARWILLDYGDFVVHVFQPAEREFYRLEKLWGDAQRVPYSPGAGA
jgi:ribosome-associated protein